MLKKVFSYLLLSIVSVNFYGQNDSLLNKKKHLFIVGGDSSTVFKGNRIAEREDTSVHHSIKIEGYVSSYYAHYSDEIESGGFVQFPTMAPRNNQFGLNLAQVGLEYKSRLLRSNITLHYGDIPESVWPKTFNLIQEAHAGFRIVKGLWLDAGFFRTHIGVESVQPRENVTSSMAVLTYYEPYYLSGAKLTYEVNSKLSLQLNVFDGYNEYLENNKNKALGFSALYEVNDDVNITYNFLTCDETPDNITTKHQRYFNNLYATIVHNKFSLGLEANYGWQEHTLRNDTSKTATTYSGLIVAKYQFIKKLAAYGRGEYFSDADRILTGTTDMGQYIMGTTLGMEYKPLKNSALSLEGRLLQSDKLIFKESNYNTNQRYELIVCLDVWF